MIIFFISLCVISVLIFICVLYFFKQKDIILRIQLVNVLISFIIIFIAIYCYYIKKPQYIDIALAYAVINYVGILALSKYFKNLKNQDSLFC